MLQHRNMFWHTQTGLFAFLCQHMMAHHATSVRNVLRLSSSWSRNGRFWSLHVTEVWSVWCICICICLCHCLLIVACDRSWISVMYLYLYLSLSLSFWSLRVTEVGLVRCRNGFGEETVASIIVRSRSQNMGGCLDQIATIYRLRHNRAGQPQ